MRRGASPTEAARIAIKRIADYYPNFMGAVVALRKDGLHGAACNGISSFHYVVHDKSEDTYQIKEVPCILNQ
jgi:N4-(beta-N-acetylglucosaminyl)-L-asparaginase